MDKKILESKAKKGMDDKTFENGIKNNFKKAKLEELTYEETKKLYDAFK